MIMRMKRTWLWLLVLAMSSLVAGCGSGSSSDSEGASTIVTVTDYSGIRIPNTTVVMGDSNGAMKAHGVTDANGQITFANAPANGTVTAAAGCLRSGATTTTYSINVQYDVNGSAVLSLDNCTGPSIVYPVNPGSAVPLGTVTVNVTNIPGEVVRNQITIGRHVLAGIGGLVTTQTVTLNQNDLDTDETFSIIVTGRDTVDDTIAYGLLLDQKFTNGMTVNVAMQPMGFVQAEITNLPTTAVSFYPSISLSRTGKQEITLGRSYSLSSAPSSTIVQMPYIPGFGDGVTYRLDVNLDQDRNGIADSRQRFEIAPPSSTPSDHAFDLNKALTAPYVMVTGAETATPTLSWSGVDPASASIYAGASMRSSSTSWYLGFSKLIRSRTSIRYPELPDSLAMFRPYKVDYFSVYTYGFEGNTYKSSSGSYQALNP